MTEAGGREELDGLHLAWVSQDDLPTGVDWLTASEQEVLDGFRLHKRRADWLLGRWAAKQAVWAALAAEAGLGTQSGPGTQSVSDPTDPDLAILASEDGSPRVHIGSGGDAGSQISISISHSAGLGFSVAGPGTGPLGCDVEHIEPRSDAFVADYFTDGEQDAVAAVAGWDHALMANLVWSAKESALKALGEGLRLDTRSVEMDTAELKVNGAAWSPLVVTGPGERIFRGWWRVRDGFVWTVLTEAH